MIERRADGLCVSGPMLIANANALLTAGRGFLRAAAGGASGSGSAAGEVLLDLSAVAETDSSALSVILALQRTARECGVTLRVANTPASMISQAALYGVSDFLPLA